MLVRVLAKGLPTSSGLLCFRFSMRRTVRVSENAAQLTRAFQGDAGTRVLAKRASRQVAWLPWHEAGASSKACFGEVRPRVEAHGLVAEEVWQGAG